MSSFQGSTAPKNGISPYGDVVEIGLLLPANWANALVALSRQRQQSVAQLLRGLIGQALTDDGTNYKLAGEITDRCPEN